MPHIYDRFIQVLGIFLSYDEVSLYFVTHIYMLSLCCTFTLNTNISSHSHGHGKGCNYGFCRAHKDRTDVPPLTRLVPLPIRSIVFSKYLINPSLLGVEVRDSMVDTMHIASRIIFGCFS
jgi:hypothetical protein